MIEIFFYFLIYAFGGWLLENVHSWKTTGVFFKENFLKSPMKPMYGIAPVLLVYGAKLLPYWMIVVCLCFLIPSTVEYLTGMFFEKYFEKKWWDYSHEAFQLHGHVCLRFSIYWTILSLGVLYFLHPMVANLYEHSASILTLGMPILVSLVCVDIFLAIFLSVRERMIVVIDDK